MFKVVTLMLFAFSIMGKSAATQSIVDYFPEAKGNLTKITWAHAVNKAADLTIALEGNIMMIEADVNLDQYTGSAIDIPVMEHNKGDLVDMSLEKFLNDVIVFLDGKNVKKGIKLDFKTIDAFIASVPVIGKFKSKILFPLWVNADILKGPINADTTPVDPKQFLDNAKLILPLELLVFSIGWTTKYDTIKGNYNNEQIEAMLKVIEDNKVDKQSVTFPVRAGLAAESLEQMQKLVTQTTGSTLTIWSSEGDNVDVDKLRNLIAKIGLKNVFVDVPKDLQDKLRLDQINNGSVSNVVSSSLIVSVLAVLFFTLMM